VDLQEQDVAVIVPVILNLVEGYPLSDLPATAGAWLAPSIMR